MKKITKIAFALLVVAGVSMNAQTALKNGSVTYSMTMPGAGEEMAAMGESTITVHFNDQTQATDMSMMGGMMLMKTIVPIANEKESKMTVEVMGMKYEITDAGEAASKSTNGLSNLQHGIFLWRPSSLRQGKTLSSQTDLLVPVNDPDGFAKIVVDNFFFGRCFGASTRFWRALELCFSTPV